MVADGGRRRRPLFGSIVSLVVVGALAVGVLAIAGVLTGVLDFANPFATSTVDRSSPALLKELNNLSSYSAAQGRFQQTIDVEDDVSILPSFIAGERTTFVANGTVDATVDFSALSTAAVQPRGDGAVTITLPEPRLDRAVIDPKTSRVVGPRARPPRPRRRDLQRQPHQRAALLRARAGQARRRPRSTATSSSARSATPRRCCRDSSAGSVTPT